MIIRKDAFTFPSSPWKTGSPAPGPRPALSRTSFASWPGHWAGSPSSRFPPPPVSPHSASARSPTAWTPSLPVVPSLASHDIRRTHWSTAWHGSNGRRERHPRWDTTRWRTTRWATRTPWDGRRHPRRCPHHSTWRSRHRRIQHFHDLVPVRQAVDHLNEALQERPIRRQEPRQFLHGRTDLPDQVRQVLRLHFAEGRVSGREIHDDVVETSRPRVIGNAEGPCLRSHHFIQRDQLRIARRHHESERPLCGKLDVQIGVQEPSQPELEVPEVVERLDLNQCGLDGPRPNGDPGLFPALHAHPASIDVADPVQRRLRSLEQHHQRCIGWWRSVRLDSTLPDSVLSHCGPVPRRAPLFLCLGLIQERVRLVQASRPRRLEVVLHHHRPALVDLVLRTHHGLHESHDVAVRVRALPQMQGEVRGAKGILAVERRPPLCHRPATDDQQPPNGLLGHDLPLRPPRQDHLIGESPNLRIALRHLSLDGTLGSLDRQVLTLPQRPVIELDDADLLLLRIEQRPPHSAIEIQGHSYPLSDIGLFDQGIADEAGVLPVDLHRPIWEQLRQPIRTGHDREGHPVAIGHIRLPAVQVPAELRPISGLDVNQRYPAIWRRHKVAGHAPVPADDPFLEDPALLDGQRVLVPLVLEQRGPDLCLFLVGPLPRLGDPVLPVPSLLARQEFDLWPDLVERHDWPGILLTLHLGPHRRIPLVPVVVLEHLLGPAPQILAIPVLPLIDDPDRPRGTVIRHAEVLLLLHGPGRLPGFVGDVLLKNLRVCHCVAPRAQKETANRRALGCRFLLVDPTPLIRRGLG